MNTGLPSVIEVLATKSSASTPLHCKQVLFAKIASNKALLLALHPWLCFSASESGYHNISERLPPFGAAPPLLARAAPSAWHVLQLLNGWLASPCCLTHSVGTALANGLQHAGQRPS